MSRISVEGRIEALPLEAQEVIRDIVRELNDIRRRVQRGAGDPDGVIVGFKGDQWQRTDGTASEALYVFEGVNGSASGWVAK